MKEEEEEEKRKKTWLEVDDPISFKVDDIIGSG